MTVIDSLFVCGSSSLCVLEKMKRLLELLLCQRYYPFKYNEFDIKH